MSTEQFSLPPAEIVDTLSLHKQVLVKSGCIIDEQRDKNHTQKLVYGQLTWADWTDPVDGMNFQLQELTERKNPEELFMQYRLIAYNDLIDDPVIDFSYESQKTRIYKKLGKGKPRKCSSEEISVLLEYLQTAPVNGLTDFEEVSTEFNEIMRASKIPNQDPRFRAEVKRTFVSGVLRLLSRSPKD